jgi:hypothetical protein
MECGYIFRLNNFKLSVIFGDDYDMIDYPYLIRSDRVFWDLLSWIYYNKSVLEQFDGSVIFGLSYRYNEMTVDSDKESSFDVSFTPDTLSNVICSNVKALIKLPLQDVPSDENIKIPIFIISTPISDQVGIEHLFRRSQIFFGSISETMRNWEKGIEYILFWDINSANTYCDDYKKNNYHIEKIFVDKNNVFDIFDRMY